MQDDCWRGDRELEKQRVEVLCVGESYNVHRGREGMRCHAQTKPTPRMPWRGTISGRLLDPFSKNSRPDADDVAPCSQSNLEIA